MVPVLSAQEAMTRVGRRSVKEGGARMASTHLHLELLGAGGLQLGGDGALQSVSLQGQTLAAVVGDGQNLTLHGLAVHPVTLRRKRRTREANSCTATGAG